MNVTVDASILWEYSMNKYQSKTLFDLTDLLEFRSFYTTRRVTLRKG